MLQWSWKGGYTGFTSSIHPSVHPYVHLSVDKIVSALYLPKYLPDPFYICTSYQATSEGVSYGMVIAKLKNLNFWNFFKICNFDFVLLWHGIWYESIVWIIMGRRRVFSECRHSSCSSCGCFVSYEYLLHFWIFFFYLHHYSQSSQLKATKFLQNTRLL